MFHRRQTKRGTIVSGPRIEYAEIALPDFGLPGEQPVIPAATYEARMAAARQRSAAAGYDVLLVYADREHFANLAYLTGFDPRFEEALLILPHDAMPTLLVGNEDMAYTAICTIPLRRVLYQTFSLLSQPRSSSPALAQALRDTGVPTSGSQRVGVAGWKYFLPLEAPRPDHWLEVPAYLVDTLREMGCDVRNAGPIFMEPEHGLRATSDVDQLAAFEFAAAHGSQGLRRLLFNARPGMTEFDAFRLLGPIGLPLCYHPVLLSGERTALGLAGPSSRLLRAGDPVFAAMGYWGSNNARAGFLVESAAKLPAAIGDYLDKLVIPYFRAVAEWYEHVGIGVTGGELFDTIERHLGDPFFGVTLNPGHLIHLDEWVSSPIHRGSRNGSVRGWPCKSMSSRPPILLTTPPTLRTVSRSWMCQCGKRSRKNIRRPGAVSSSAVLSCATLWGFISSPRWRRSPTSRPICLRSGSRRNGLCVSVALRSGDQRAHRAAQEMPHGQRSPAAALAVAVAARVDFHQVEAGNAWRLARLPYDSQHLGAGQPNTVGRADAGHGADRERVRIEAQVHPATLLPQALHFATKGRRQPAA